MKRFCDYHAIRRRQRGQSMTEYVVICAVLVACLLVAETPVGAQLAQALHNFYLDFTYFISLP
jgi:hypothetical protein